ncbi:PDR/VanB family oxidoreductase [Rhodococcus sp. JS3073]|uniref:PDR/VanB family oxidoreductase n=1 Tax=Rhodococcus sp. JS3073 TaxID=3002901 RepID=UPI002286CD75|nr:PDR/VanB family oxidoreductase [Rhodococcus sp. JS3073]WAM17782.1 PDR/VanB family oxidoreductase [Rhodococcus sp. JS3073]
MSTSSSDTQTLPLRVVAAHWEARSITSYEFARADGGELPAWEPGAHVDVHLPSGMVRQYSLCGDPADSTRYRIAVLELPAGRGGSVEVHRELRPGRPIRIGRPRSNFGLAEADRYVFVAGGIGITPMLPMIREVQRRGGTWELVYGARTAEHFAFVSELDASAVQLVPQDTSGHLDLESVVASSAGAAVYCCGPTPLMDALVERMSKAGRADDLYLERFAASAPMVASSGEFEVELARSEKFVQVRPDQTVLEAVRDAGIDHPSSCEMGICGSCEVKVLGGDVDHRDDLLTESERAQCNSMMICVSRARGDRLVLDL